jgi:hypothetical protein
MLKTIRKLLYKYNRWQYEYWLSREKYESAEYNRVRFFCMASLSMCGMDNQREPLTKVENKRIKYAKRCNKLREKIIK